MLKAVFLKGLSVDERVKVLVEGLATIKSDVLNILKKFVTMGGERSDSLASKILNCP